MLLKLGSTKAIQILNQIIKKQKWAKNLKNIQVDIYLGTWCGDSKYWVPKFIKLWDELGLNKNQLKLIALYGGKERYKQVQTKKKRA